MDEYALLEKRIGGQFGHKGGEKYSSASWPIGKLTMYPESLNVKLFLISVELPYTDIKLIEGELLRGIRIRHAVVGEPEYVSISGFGLMKEIKRTNAEQNLGLKID